ncbi:MAG: multidrug ABC transporter substrate-binding protein [Verrucomicrobia bacterium 12-59-8]|nr:MAG: multidrug ABC transporter substrate-binding protein [Verrucomicrobia bacterium 12-59-8]
MRAGLTAMIAFRALRRNKLRSTLTALGIIIGVASVVAIMAVGRGTQRRIQDQVSSLGSNLLIVFSKSRRTNAAAAGSAESSNLTLEDVESIRREVRSVKAASPEVTLTAQAVAAGRNWSTTIAGESPGYLHIRDWPLARGSMFTEREVRSAARVAVIGSRTARELFGPLNPVGQTVRIKNMPFTIIGELESKGAGMGGANQDDRIVIPYTTAMRRLTGDKYPRLVTLQISSDGLMSAAQEQVTALLRQRHRLADGRKNDFDIVNQKEIADTVNSITTMLTYLLGGIAGLSLLVGGIGIMNIMLVSVTERTREIGTRIAVGAQPADILLQFLIESITLSLLGGAIGVALGYGISAAASMIPNFHPSVSIGSVVVAFGISFIVGVFFGFYPARKAANMNPIAALRFE